MEQHYIVSFGIVGEHMASYYLIGVIIPKYPGDPNKLITEILSFIEEESVKAFGKFILRSSIALRMVTKVN